MGGYKFHQTGSWNRSVALLSHFLALRFCPLGFIPADVNYSLCLLFHLFVPPTECNSPSLKALSPMIALRVEAGRSTKPQSCANVDFGNTGRAEMKTQDVSGFGFCVSGWNSKLYERIRRAHAQSWND